MSEVSVTLKKTILDKNKYSSYVVHEDVISEIVQNGNFSNIRLNSDKADEAAPTIGIILAKQDGYYAIGEHYVSCLSKYKANLKFISYHNVEEQLEEIDGLLVPGGSYDSPAEWYQREAKSDLGPRSLANLKATKYAIDKKLPIFGICAGMQMIAGVVGYDYGVRFHLNLALETGCKEVHRDLAMHDIIIKKSSKLYEYIGQEFMKVNSDHKEAVVLETVFGNESPLLVSAVSREGVVEAIEIKRYPTFAIGVQWHPERLAVNKDDEGNKKLFEAFVSASAKSKNKKAPL